MKTTVTLRIKLDMAPAVSARLAETRHAYVDAMNRTSGVAFDQQITSGVTLHHATYRDIREATGLPANLVCSARAVVAEAYTRDKARRHRFGHKAAMRYDARTLRFDLQNESATLSTLKGRVRVSLVVCDYHRRFLDGSWTFAKGGALKQVGKVWYLHLTAGRETPDSEAPGVLGVDAGIKRIAATSKGTVHKGGSVSQTRRRKFRQRRKLQKKAGHKSRNQRRLLQRLAGSEHRAVEWKLWNVANAIVNEAADSGCGTIAVEDLAGIRGRIRAAKKQRLIQQGWPFASSQAKVRHVASRRGIKVVAVNARNTSRACSRCGHTDKANRPTQSDFRCLSCGYRQNADLNAAHNIRLRHVGGGCVAVSQRRMSAG